MQILVLLGMYFNAVVVFVTSQTFLFRLALAILWQIKINFLHFIFQEFVVCPLCLVRFNTFTFLEQHIKKSHGDQKVAFNSIPQNPETSKVPTLSDESYDCETKTETQVIENNDMQEKQSEEINCDSDSSYYESECRICQARFLDQKCMNEHIAKKHVFLST